MPRLCASFVAVSFFVQFSASGQERFAGRIVDYFPGSGYAAGYTNPVAAIGEPSRVTPGEFGGPVDPFNPPYLPTQLVSVGSNGVLTVEFSAPIRNDPAHPFGLDFIVFGNAGFIITNGDYSGGGITDGSMFGDSRASTVSVSADNLSYFRLRPDAAPPIDSLFPTDGSGDFFRPVNGQLNSAAFTGLGLAEIRNQYDGSAGGAGFDLSWAQDADNQFVQLDAIRFIRIEISSGHAEIDGFAAVPEPGTSLLLVSGLACLLLIVRRHEKFRTANV